MTDTPTWAQEGREPTADEFLGHLLQQPYHHQREMVALLLTDHAIARVCVEADHLHRLPLGSMQRVEWRAASGKLNSAPRASRSFAADFVAKYGGMVQRRIVIQTPWQDVTEEDDR